MLLRKEILGAVLLLSLISCSSDNKNTEIKQPVVENHAIDDVLHDYWSESIVVDVLVNDTINSVSASLSIVEEPSAGSVSIDSGTFIYSPSTKQKTVDSFRYQIVDENGAISNTATVELQLGNDIKLFSITDDVIESNESTELIVELILPAVEPVSVKIQQLIGDVDDGSFKVIKAEIASGESAIRIPYSPDVVAEHKFETDHKLTLTAEQFPSLNQTIAYQYLNLSDPDKMFLSIKNIWYNQGSANLMLRQRGLVMSWMNYPIWSIPEQPLWSEDPYKNNSWQLYYHSLFWLFAYEYAYDSTGNEEYLDIIGKTILDYFAKSPKSNPQSYMSWDDHSVSWRTDVVTYFYNKHFRDRWNSAEKQSYFKGLDEHAGELRALLDNPLFEKNNHGMFHALSLYNLAHAFPKRTLNTDYKSRSYERIFALFDNMVDTETGVSLEQATHYQLVAIDLFIVANQLIVDLSGRVDETVNGYLTKMVDFTAHLLYPNGEAPEVGDSNYGHKNYLKTLNKYIENKGISSQYLDYVNTKGEAGKALERVYKSDSAGYAILRPTGLTETDWQSQTAIFADFGRQKYAHGHQDAMSLTAYSDGTKLLVDSGGPYVYLPPGRTYFWSRYGHNTLVVNGESNILNDAELLQAKCVQTNCYAVGRLLQSGQEHFRLIVSIGEPTPNIYVFDYVKASSSNKYELIYHLPIEANVSQSIDGYTVGYGNNKVVNFNVLSNTAYTKSYYHGHVNGDEKQGWVTPKYAQQEPAPVITFTSYNTDFWALTSIEQVGDFNDTVSYDSNKNEFELMLAGKKVLLSLSNENQLVTFH